MFSFSLDKYPEMELLERMIVLFSVFLRKLFYHDCSKMIRSPDISFTSVLIFVGCFLFIVFDIFWFLIWHVIVVETLTLSCYAVIVHALFQPTILIAFLWHSFNSCTGALLPHYCQVEVPTQPLLAPGWGCFFLPPTLPLASSDTAHTDKGRMPLPAGWVEV